MPTPRKAIATAGIATCLFLFAACVAGDLCVEVQDHPEFGRWELKAVTEVNKHAVYTGVVKNIEGSEMETIVPWGNSIVESRYIISIRDRKDSALMAYIREDGEGTLSRISIVSEPEIISMDYVSFTLCSSNSTTAAPRRLRGDFEPPWTTNSYIDDAVLAPATANPDDNSTSPPMCYRFNGLGTSDVSLQYVQSDRFNNNYYQLKVGYNRDIPLYGIQSPDGWASIHKIETKGDDPVSTLLTYWVPMDHSDTTASGTLWSLWSTDTGNQFLEPSSAFIWDCREF